MFKIQNNQPTLANQQPLDEIELRFGQEMVELSGQELMNVVGGKNEAPEDPRFIYVKPSEGSEIGVDDPPQGELIIDPSNSNGIITIRPDSSN